MTTAKRTTSIEAREIAALENVERLAPDQDQDQDQDPSMAMFGEDVDSYDEQGGGTSGDDATARDWAVAEGALPTMPDETSDGLNDTDEEVRRMAEELLYDEPLEERIRRKAYEIWESEGGPHGRAEDHWRIAAELVAQDDAARSSLLPYRGGADELVEEGFVQDNLGEFPSLADQGGQIDERGQSHPDRA